MLQYQIKQPKDLTAQEVLVILSAWEVGEWKALDLSTFQTLFSRSEFHLLFDATNTILSLARLNFDFKINIANKRLVLPEFVGFVSLVKGKGYGTLLLKHMLSYLHNTNTEAIGFCEKELRSFYEKCNIPILYNQAKYLQEPAEKGGWITGTDDDILVLQLTAENRSLLQTLSISNQGYLVPPCL
ncbi:GNAT family N-acetyltransferase [Flavisolibacter tropicus]|uniref:N-acetyltransferase domain-containing protein n=1 Tax=Flavisolibacter tropicus TaxID=1492898 RepID=A0A172TYK8_9BACT|nr:GNAT family N-acetyltransferase [Flavisolibacter tropicus]ANE52130.1 hypothetical protein SY85_18165 [Flavisolibacter tropicus]